MHRYRPALLFLLLFVTACTSTRQVIYFQDLHVGKADSLQKTTPYLLRPNDLLSLTVTSLDPISDRPFAAYQVSQDQSGTHGGYLIDSAGDIHIPYAGTVPLAGLSLYQAAQKITLLLNPHLKEPAVNLRLANYSVSVLGEVNRAGLYHFPTERVTLSEALSLAGDLTINARRDSILVIRESGGLRSYAKFDLRKSDILNSSYYYLHPNDVIYVPPAKSKIAQADTRRWQVMAFIATVLSLTTVLISRIN